MHHEALDDTVEDNPVVVAVSCVSAEVLDRLHINHRADAAGDDRMAGRGGGVLIYSFVASLSRWIIDHASLSTRNTVSNLNTDTSNTWVLSNFINYINVVAYIMSFMFRRRRAGSGADKRAASSCATYHAVAKSYNYWGLSLWSRATTSLNA